MVNEGERVLYPSIEKNLRTEYEQTWQDFRHRTTVEMTILSVYFATTAGLVYTFAQHGTGPAAGWIGPAIWVIGVFLSAGVLVLLLGERRPWSADITRLEELDSLLSHKRSRPVRLERIRYYDRLWTRKGYSLSLAGSFAWFLLLVVGTGATLGGIFGFWLAETHGSSTPISAILWAIMTFLLLTVLVLYVIYKTMRNSLEKALKDAEKALQESEKKRKDAEKALKDVREDEQ